MEREDAVKAMQMGRQKMAERCLVTAELLIREAGVTVVEHRGQALRGRAWSAKKRIRVPKPTTRRRLYILAHECGHVALGHSSRRISKHRKEYEAEQYAHAALRRHGISVPKASTTRAKQYVAWKIKQAIKRGAKSIDMEALKWCRGELSEAVKGLLRQKGITGAE